MSKSRNKSPFISDATKYKKRLANKSIRKLSVFDNVLNGGWYKKYYGYFGLNEYYVAMTSTEFIEYNDMYHNYESYEYYIKRFLGK